MAQAADTNRGYGYKYEVMTEEESGSASEMTSGMGAERASLLYIQDDGAYIKHLAGGKRTTLVRKSRRSICVLLLIGELLRCSS